MTLDLVQSPANDRQQLVRELEAIGAHYGISDDEIKAAIDGVDMHDYLEYTLCEEGLELTVGGVGHEEKFLTYAHKFGASDAVIDAFNRLSARFPGHLSGFKFGLGGRVSPPSMYILLMEPWEEIWPFLETLPDIRPSIPELKVVVGEAPLCVILAFQANPATGELMAKTYHLCPRSPGMPETPVYVSYRLSSGTVLGARKAYWRLDHARALDTIQGALNEPLAICLSHFKRDYWMSYGVTQGSDPKTKVYVYRVNTQMQPWGERTSSMYTEQGRILMQREEFRHALASFNDAVAYIENDYAARMNRGYCKAILGDHAGAREDAKAACLLEPNMNFGQAEAFAQEIENIADLQKQLSEDTDGRAHNMFGVALFQKGFVKTACQHFETAIGADPKNAEAYNNLSGSLINLGAYRKAFEMASKAIELRQETDKSNYMTSLTMMRLPDSGMAPLDASA